MRKLGGSRRWFAVLFLLPMFAYGPVRDEGMVMPDDYVAPVVQKAPVLYSGGHEPDPWG